MNVTKREMRPYSLEAIRDETLETKAPSHGARYADELVEQSGPLLSGKALWQALGFSGSPAFRQAKARGQLDVRVFKLPGRRGTFAFTSDVAEWLRKLDGEAPM